MPDKTESLTITYKPETAEYLLEAYPDALGVAEAFRHSVSEVRYWRETVEVVAEAENPANK